MSEFIPRAFSSAYGSALGGILHAPFLQDTDYALSKDDQSYELMRRDAIVAHAFSFRKHLAAGLDWHLEPASAAPHDKKVAAILESMLRKLPHFASARYNLSEAIIRGEAWGGLQGSWTTCALAGGQVRRWWLVTGITDIDKRRFRPAQDKPSGPQQGSPSWHWEIQRFFPYRWEPIEATTHYIHHIHGSQEATLGRGYGIGNEIWHYWRDKVECLKLWLQRLDRWALGNLVAQITMDEKSRRDPNNDARIASWMAVLKKMRAGHVCVFDIKDTIKLVEATGDGSEISRAIAYFDDGIIRLSLGALMPTGSNNVNGSYARADVEADSTNLIIRFDHLELEESLTRQTVELLYRANYRSLLLETAGVQPSGCPDFRLNSDRKGDPAKNADILTKILPLMPVRLDEAYAKLGLTPPAPGDPTIGGPPALAATPGGVLLPPGVNVPGAAPAPAATLQTVNPRVAAILARARSGELSRDVKPAPASQPQDLEGPAADVSPKNRIARLLAEAKMRARGAP